MLFIGIIASLILVYTSDNLKILERKGMGSNNFYTAENVIDEVKTNLDELADQAIRTAYTKWLQQYTTTPSGQQEIVFKKLFASALKDLLNSQFVPYASAGANPNPSQLLYQFDSTNVQWLKSPSITMNGDETQLTLKDISIAYTDNRGFTTYITTDMIFDLRYPGFQTTIIQGTKLAAADYIIIADEQITNNLGINGIIKGNLYGGGYNPSATTVDKYNTEGIFINSDSGLQIYADKILSRSTIRIADRSSVKVKGMNGEYDYTGTLSYSDVWAKNILLDGTSSQANPVQLQLQGNCYLADDLTLNAEASEFNLKGTYYGYSINNAYLGATDISRAGLVSGTPEGSSSIILNAKDAVLNLTNATKIWIAGKSFVSVPYRYGLGATPDNLSFAQGEAITYRGLQAAYLLPGDCIVGIGHNPMTAGEYAKLTTNPASCYVDISMSRRKGGIRLEDYVNRSTPYRVANVDYNGTDTMVYLYLNFQSSDKATQFSEQYITTNEELVDLWMGTFGDGKILFNPTALYNIGNAVGYSSGTVTQTDSKYSVSNADMEDKQIELSSQYSGLVTSLDEKYAGANLNGFLTDTVVDMSKITQNAQTETDLNYQIGGISYKLITGDDITINTSTTGIVIAKGDVSILNSASFTGLIIARGKVMIQGNVNLNADPDHIGYLIQNHDVVSPYFSLSNAGTAGNGGSIFASDLVTISYDNWRKN
jgi:hypothetical protein